MHMNPKVLAALAAVGLAIYVLVPNLFYAALPLLVLAACPLSMFLMMKMMSGGKKDPTEPGSEAVASSSPREERGACWGEG